MNNYPSFNPKIHRAVRFEIVAHYMVRLKFDDGTERVIDFKPILTGPIFGPLKDKKLFDRVALDPIFGALEWPNGADISPAVLYDWDDHIEAMLIRRQQDMVAT